MVASYLINDPGRIQGTGGANVTLGAMRGAGQWCFEEADSLIAPLALISGSGVTQALSP